MTFILICGSRLLVPPFGGGEEDLRLPHDTVVALSMPTSYLPPLLVEGNRLSRTIPWSTFAIFGTISNEWEMMSCYGNINIILSA